MRTAKTSRKSHNKTRTGCQTCKKRKIKCDESTPSCQNCVKHDVQCDFELNHRQRSRSIRNSATPPDAALPTGASRGHSDTLQHHVSQPPSPVLPLTELKLLHNFCCFTCHTFSPNIALRNLWRINVPQLGFAHEFVMRGLLALSALHLAHTNKDKSEDYFAQAATQQQAALNIAMPLLNELTTENCLNLYIFSIQTVIYGLGKPRQPGDLLLVGTATDAVPDWLYLLRGTRSIVELSKPILHASTLAPMFHIARRRGEQLGIITSKERHLEELRAQINEVVDRSVAETYNETIDKLQTTFARVCNVSKGSYEFNATDPDFYDVFTWPYLISDDYLLHLQQFSPVALTILAHFCVLLHTLDGHWWMQGWSQHLITTIFSSLGPEHRLWIQWPIEEIGWNPDRS